jgi:hypothetical protein
MIVFLFFFINKLLWLGFAFSTLSILYYLFIFFNNFFKKEPQQLNISTREKIAIGIYLAYIIMSICTGIKL